jgi:hypothetical protein
VRCAADQEELSALAVRCRSQAPDASESAGRICCRESDLLRNQDETEDSGRVETVGGTSKAMKNVHCLVGVMWSFQAEPRSVAGSTCTAAGRSRCRLLTAAMPAAGDHHLESGLINKKGGNCELIRALEAAKARHLGAQPPVLEQCSVCMYRPCFLNLLAWHILLLLPTFHHILAMRSQLHRGERAVWFSVILRKKADQVPCCTESSTSLSKSSHA